MANRSEQPMTRRIVLLQALASTIPDIDRLVPAFCSNSQGNGAVAVRPSAIGLLVQLSAREETFQSQLARIITEDRPVLAAAVPSVAQELVDDTVAHAAERFAGLRKETLVSLGALRPGEWQRAAFFNGPTSRSLRFLVQDLVDHDIACTNQLVQLLVEFRRKELAAAKTPGQATP